MRRFTTWLGEWIETLRVAPPFSRRRRDLLEILADEDIDTERHFDFRREP